MSTPNPAIEPYFLKVAAHEMGHVMGLNHEHQCYDRTSSHPTSIASH
jgi:predicted Zn-dependent protease